MVLYKNLKKIKCENCKRTFKQNTPMQKFCKDDLCLKDRKRKQRNTSGVMGRKSEYKPEYCEMLIKHMAGGLSFETFGSDLRISNSATYRWVNTYPEFKDAKRLGTQLCQQFWEKMGLHGAAGKLKNFNSTAYIYNVKCRFRKSETYGPIAEETPTFNFNLNYDPTNLGDDDG